MASFFLGSDHAGLSSLIGVIENLSSFAGLHVFMSGRSRCSSFHLLSCRRFLLQGCLSPPRGGLLSCVLFLGGGSKSLSAVLRSCASCLSAFARQTTLWSISATPCPWVISSTVTRSKFPPVCEGVLLVLLLFAGLLFLSLSFLLHSLLAGRELSGKTSLVKRLFGEARPTPVDRTSGIEVHSLQLGDEHALLLDCGGHAVYHIFHEHFLSDAAVALVVVLSPGVGQADPTEPEKLRLLWPRDGLWPPSPCVETVHSH